MLEKLKISENKEIIENAIEIGMDALENWK